jgi:hypothetical protein
VGCARCHNHKSDKVSQKEYFQLQAFFANTSFDEKAKLDKGTETAWDVEWQKQQAAYQAATKEIRDKQKAILDTVREAAVKYEKERYLTDSRDSLFKAESDWNALDRWVNFRYKTVASQAEIISYLKLTAEDKDSTLYNAANLPKYKEYEKLTEELKKFDNLKPKARGTLNYTAATELGHTDSPPTNIRFTGIHERPMDEVQPGIPALWGGDQVAIAPLKNSSGRRAALANWVASASNPLTPRVYVNRVWNQYFANGIVPTLGDFGRAGQKPTNPELLDYLASEFVRDGWSVKKLQREILLSSTYRQSSAERVEALKIDPDNKLLAYFPIKRMDAEEIRDSLLYVSGDLDETIGGPSVFPPIPGSLKTTLWEKSDDPKDQNRRSLYTFVRRSVPYPLTANFDPADPSKAHQRRTVTTTPLQALTLFNSDLVFGWSKDLAGRVIRESGKDENAQINHLYEILFARQPNKEEKAALKEFLVAQEKIILQKQATGKFDIAVPTGLKDPAQFNPVRNAAFVDLVHTVANSNDFAYRF